MASCVCVFTIAMLCRRLCKAPKKTLPRCVMFMCTSAWSFTTKRKRHTNTLSHQNVCTFSLGSYSMAHDVKSVRVYGNSPQHPAARTKPMCLCLSSEWIGKCWRMKLRPKRGQTKQSKPNDITSKGGECLIFVLYYVQFQHVFSTHLFDKKTHIQANTLQAFVWFFAVS